MNTGKQYKTRQREYILEYIKNRKGSYVTIPQIAEYLDQKAEKVGLTTIYRTLDKLEREKVIHRSSIDGIKGSCFRYSEQETEELFSMKCEKCGKVVDIQCPELGKLYDHLAEEHSIKVDPEKTVLYGVCTDCKESKE